jgi:MFS family permease
MFTGTLGWGYYSDIYGRIKAYRIAGIMISICSAALALAPNYYIALAAFAIVGNGVGSDLVNSSTIITEFLPVSKRWLITLVTISWALGSSLLAGIALITSYLEIEAIVTFRLCVSILCLLTIVSSVLRF